MRACFALATVLVLSSVAAPAQESPQTDQLFTSDLIAWSFMQQPRDPDQQRTQPRPEPSPETQPPQNPTPGNQSPSAAPSAPSEGKTATAQTFVGNIAQEADGYVLRVSATTSYKLDNQHEVQQFVGQRVRVIGTLDREINLIHVDKVEPLS